MSGYYFTLFLNDTLYTVSLSTVSDFISKHLKKNTLHASKSRLRFNLIKSKHCV